MLSQTLYRLTADGADGADPGTARRFATEFLSLSATKIADGLIDPKLVLAWLFSALGVPGALTGALVPVREAGALLPQLALARAIERRRRRRFVWAAGAALQGLAALSMAAAALLLEGAAAGWAILAALAVLACARAACSASFKDVTARTVEKGTRGTLTGIAGTVGAAAVFLWAVLLGLGIVPRDPVWIAASIAAAGALWLAAGALFATLEEPPAEPDETGGAGALLRPFRDDPQFRRYLLARALMISTSLAPPFLVMLAGTSSGGGPGNLGVLMIASSAASILSSYVWGRLSDRSSRRTLAYAGFAAAAILGAGAALGLATGGLGGSWGAAGFIFAAQIAYQGARIGRKTHLTDMETPGGKATYTALANTAIGALLLLGGGFGLLAEAAGPAAVLAVFAAMAAGGGLAALRLGEVQQPG
ncbi:MFS transporter [Mangrovicoccus sp. HB161399]|uniref:MFS transporter n=1 Tax=Mangrovicoccus sp. HB161399 TaxID=2720392 RepID=UPI0020A63CF5|nr:MFS transporter [Mangrovicoccus sp. HB161399]